MKRTVYNTMIGLMLASGLAITSTGALAQGRRPATSTNAAAAGNRTSVASAPKSNAVVTNNKSSVNRSSATTSVTSRPSSISTNVNTSISTSRSGSVNASSRCEGQHNCAPVLSNAISASLAKRAVVADVLCGETLWSEIGISVGQSYA